MAKFKDTLDDISSFLNKKEEAKEKPEPQSNDYIKELSDRMTDAFSFSDKVLMNKYTHMSKNKTESK